MMLNSHVLDQILLRYRALSQNPRVEHLYTVYQNSVLLDSHLRVLSEIARVATDAGAAFRLVPFDLTVRHNTRSQHRYESFARACEARGIVVWRMGTIFEGIDYRALTLNNWDHHPGPHANRLVGEFLAGQVTHEVLNIARRQPSLRQYSSVDIGI